MDKYQKETEKILLNHEKEVFKQLKGTYLNALNQIKKNVAKLKDDIDELVKANPDNKTLIQSKVYQLNYQKAMEQQLNEVLDVVRRENVNNVETFLKKMYEDSFLSINYHLQQKGIPVIMPINHKLLVDTLNTPTNKLKFSDRLYKHIDELKQTVKAEISRGIAVGSSYKDMARQISDVARIDLNKAYRIARTEGGRVSSEAKLQSMKEAKNKGADVVKVWDATLDGNTRELHRKLDQQRAEVDEPFIVDGIKVMRPHGFKSAGQNVNCRCVLLSVPRWDLEDEVVKYDNENHQLIKTGNYATWKKGYYEILKENKRISDVVAMAATRIDLYEKGYALYDLTKDDVYAINTYTSSEAYTINDALRNGYELDERLTKIVEDLSKALKKMPTYDGVVNRSLFFNNQKEYDTFINTLYNSGIIEFNSFLSTAKDVYDENEDIRLIIKSKNGKDISMFNENEQEVLFDRNSKFEVTDVYTENNKVFFELEEIE